MIDITKPVRFKLNKEPVRILCTDLKNTAPVAVVVTDDKGSESIWFYPDLERFENYSPRKSQFMNVYGPGAWSSQTWFKSLSSANAASSSAYRRQGVIEVVYERETFVEVIYHPEKDCI